MFKRKKFVKRKRVFRRKRYARRKRVGTGDAKRFFKLKEISTVSSVVTSGVMILSITDDPSGAQDWGSVSALFDQYRVAAIKVRFLPSYNQVQEGATVVPSGGIYPPLYVVHDPNSTTSPLSSVNSAIEYENMKVKKMTSAWTVYYRMRRQLRISADTSTDNRGYQDASQPQPTQGIYAYGTGFSAVAETYGTILTTYYLTVKSRK